MFVQQQLATCQGCHETLAVQYQGAFRRVPSMRLHGRLFGCPACGWENLFVLPFGATRLVVKLVPGPGPCAHPSLRPY